MEAQETTKNGNGKAKAAEAPAPKGAMTSADFLRAITMQATCVGGDASALHWQCTLTYEGRTYTASYRLGVAHTTLESNGHGSVASPALREMWARQGVAYTGPIYPVAPRLMDVLAHLQATASVPKSFAKWCEATGNNPDSRAAAKAHDALKAGKKAVATWISETHLAAFVSADFGGTK